MMRSKGIPRISLLKCGLLPSNDCNWWPRAGWRHDAGHHDLSGYGAARRHAGWNDAGGHDGRPGHLQRPDRQTASAEERQVDDHHEANALP